MMADIVKALLLMVVDLAVLFVFMAGIGFIMRTWRDIRFEKKLKKWTLFVGAGRRYRCDICYQTWFLPDAPGSDRNVTKDMMLHHLGQHRQ